MMMLYKKKNGENACKKINRCGHVFSTLPWGYNTTFFGRLWIKNKLNEQKKVIERCSGRGAKIPYTTNTPKCEKR